jgi:hypothetical protein
LTTALSDWSATIGGTTAFINKSERIPATTSGRNPKDHRVATGSGSSLGFSCGTAVNGLKQSLAPWMGVSPESAASKKIFLVVDDDSLENCHRFASNNDVVLPCLRVRSSNCAKKRARGAANLAEA